MEIKSPGTLGTAPENNNQKKKTNILLIIIAVLLASNIYLFFQKSKVEVQYVQVTDEKSRLQSELDNLSVELNAATENSGKLSKELSEKDAELKARVEDLQKALKSGNLTAAQLEKAKDQIDQLKYYIKKYQTEINELKAENEKLNNENTGLKQEVQQEQKKSSNLQNENISLNNKVSVAQLLKAQSITVLPVRYKSSGAEIDASRARNTEKVKVTFNIVDNPIAPIGQRDFFLRIINPEGKLEVITDQNDSRFEAEGQSLQYTSKLNVNFENKKETKFNIYWTKSSNYEKGVYKAILYSDGVSIGSTSFELK